MVTAAHEGGTEVCRTVTVNEGILWKSAGLSVEFCWRRFREGLLMSVSRKTLGTFIMFYMCMCRSRYCIQGFTSASANDPMFSKVTHRTNTSLSLRQRPPIPVFRFHFLAKTVALLPQRARTLAATRARCSTTKGRTEFGRPI